MYECLKPRDPNPRRCKRDIFMRVRALQPRDCDLCGFTIVKGNAYYCDKLDHETYSYHPKCFESFDGFIRDNIRPYLAAFNKEPFQIKFGIKQKEVEKKFRKTRIKYVNRIKPK